MSITDTTTPYPENIIRKIGVEIVFGQDEYEELSEDQLAGLEYAISTLNAQAQKVLAMRDKDGLTFAEIGRHFGRTDKRMRQITDLALDKLRRKYLAQYYILRYQAYKSKKTENFPHIKRTSSKMAIDEIKSAMGDLADEKIEAFDISFRSINALNKEGIVTFLDLVMMIEEDPTSLRRVRNVGEKMAMEITTLMREVGLEDWTNIKETSPKNKASRGKHRIRSYPDNLISIIGERIVSGSQGYYGLTKDQLHGLEYAISTLTDSQLPRT